MGVVWEPYGILHTDKLEPPKALNGGIHLKPLIHSSVRFKDLLTCEGPCRDPDQVKRVVAGARVMAYVCMLNMYIYIYIMCICEYTCMCIYRYIHLFGMAHMRGNLVAEPTPSRHGPTPEYDTREATETKHSRNIPTV